MDWVTIDGSLGEGGGQVVRTSLALSAITGRPVRISKIRAGRARPGLAAQHLTGVEAARALCDAELEGARLGSTELSFHPGPIRGGTYRFDVGTAGAVTLVIQVVAPIVLFAPAATVITVIGGTDVPQSPLVDYCQGVFLAHLRRLGARALLEVIGRGSYPKGGGEVRFTAEPWQPVDAIDLATPGSPGSKPQLEVISMASQDLERAHVAERQIEGFERYQGSADGAGWGTIAAQTVYARMRSTGTSVHARLSTERTVLGVCTLGERGKPAERVGSAAAAMLDEEWSSGGALDRWMADQIIPFLGLLGGVIRTSAVTLHTETNMQVVARFLPIRFDVEGTAIRGRLTGQPPRPTG